MIENEEKIPKAILVEVDTGDYDAQSSLSELYELVRSAGAEPFGSLVQKRPAPDTATCIGSGMVDELNDMCIKYDVDLVVFDRELSPVQIRNLESALDLKVIDRTMLILDIFALRAISSEGKLQVELAQLKYLLPRLSGRGTQLSRLGGGIGTRGPGETKLETDKRHIRTRIQNLSNQLKQVEKHREQISRRRKKDGTITVALVGYTNAGKSTLMNKLTDAGVLAENKLFATLDPTSRVLKLPNGVSVMLIDTVGLVRRLPHNLIQAFHSTLEQAATADIILNVCDASSSEAQIHLEVTRNLLAELGCEDHPIISVMNKCDKVPMLESIPVIGNIIRISAKSGIGIDNLLYAIQDNLPVKTTKVSFLFPFNKTGIAAVLRKKAVIISEDYTENGLLVETIIDQVLLEKYSEYLYKTN